MTLSAAPPRALARALAVAATCVTGALVATGPAQAADPVAAVVDRTAATSADVPAATERAQRRLRRQLGGHALIQPDPSTGTPRIIARLDGFLSGASSKPAAEIALEYVRDHNVAFGLDGDDIAGLRLTSRERAPDGAVHLAWEQRVGGLPLVDGGLHAAVSAEGRLINVRGGAIADPGGGAPAPQVSAARAYAVADPSGAPAPAAAPPSGAERITDFDGGGRASLVRYRDGEADRLGWRLLIPAGASAFYDAIVDARTGRLERRTNRVRFAAEIRHYDVNPRALNDGAILEVVPSGWLDEDEATLKGPFAHAVSDLQDRISLGQAVPPFALTAEPVGSDEVAATSGTGLERDFSHNPTFSGACADCTWSSANRTANRAFSAQQLFWYVNTFRAHLAAPPIGFDGAAGGFEGGDRVLAQALDGALTNPGGTTPDAEHRNNASMLTLPDGYRPLLSTYLFAMGSTRYDSAHDASVVYHEYTHGLSDRLVTDTQGFGALSGAQPGAIGEGTSDFYALDYLVATGEVADTATPGEVRLGKWLQANPATLGLDGTLRTEGVDCAVGVASSACTGTDGADQGGYDYADFGRVAGAPEIHADGEIWAQTLWSLRAALVGQPSVDGLDRVRAYVTGGLRLAPEDPTMLDMRNAIVQAAVTANGNADWQTIWQVFADRGMGWSASTEGPNDVAPFAAYDVPPPPGDATGRGAIAGTINDESGAPVGGATVSIAGHDSGLGLTDLASSSGGDGGYALPGVPAASYPDLYVRKPGFQESTTGVDVLAGVTSTVNFQPLRRDYASPASGGAVSSFTGPNFDSSGCGPAQALDDDKGTVWSTYADAGPQDLVIDLGRAIDIREVRIDPRAGCGDGAGASLARYELSASDGPGLPFERIAGGIVGAPNARGYVSLELAGDASGRRLLSLRAVEPRSIDQATERPFMDVAEVEVTGTPVPPPVVAPVPTPTPGPTPLPARPTALRDSKLTATRKGMLKVRVRFSATAPSGKARLSVGRGKRRYAVALVTVRPGRTVTKTLRLNKAGRRAIKPGKSRRVTIELRLPGGKKVKKTVSLARKRR